MSRLTRSEQPWSSSILQQVVAARDRAWGECQRGVTRSQKYRAIQRYFQEAERYEGQWLEARVVFNVHKEELRTFLEDPMYGSGQQVESMTAAEYGARFWLAWGGSEWEEEWDREESGAVADLVPSAEADVIPLVEGDDSFGPNEASGGRRRDLLGFRVGSVLHWDGRRTE